MDAYFEATFFTWFSLFFHRAWSGFPGGLTSDEVQLFIFTLFASNAAILGSFLVLSRLTMMANAISHTMILGIVGSLYFQQQRGFRANSHHHGIMPHSDPLIFLFSTGTALLTSFLTRLLSQFRYIQEDAANAIVFSSLFSIGITLISIVTRNTHVGTELIMGNPDALSQYDIFQVAVTTGFSSLLFFLLYRGIIVAIFDPEYGKVAGLRSSWIITIVLVLVSVTLVISFRAVGFIMALAFFVMPPLSARCIASSVRQMILFSMAIGMTISFLSIALSRHLLTMYGIAVSTGALAVVFLSAVYCIFVGVSHMRRGMFRSELR